MPRVMKDKNYKVYLTEHSIERFRERSKKKIKHQKLINLLCTKLNDTLKTGLRVDEKGVAWIQVDIRLWACLRLDVEGWVVVTFIDRSKTSEAS